MTFSDDDDDATALVLEVSIGVTSSDDDDEATALVLELDNGGVVGTVELLIAASEEAKTK